MGAYEPDFAAPWGDLADDGRSMERRGAYAALIAAISGLMPMMLMTRLRL